MKIVQGQRPDITPAQIFAVLGAGIPIIASLLSAFGVYDLSATQQDALNKAVQWAGLVAIALFGADFGLRAARNRAQATVHASLLANRQEPPVGPVAPIVAATPAPTPAPTPTPTPAATMTSQPGLPSDEEEFAFGGPDDGQALFTGFTPAADVDQGPDSRLAPVDPDEAI